MNNKVAPIKKPILKNTTFAEYHAKELCVIPEIDAIPQVDGVWLKWGKFYSSAHEENKEGKLYKPTDDELLSWDLLSDHGKALVTGEPSGIIIIDIDHANEQQINKVIELLGDTPCKKYGSKGISLFYKYNGEKNENWIKDGVTIVELLSTGSKSTVPPSQHRKDHKVNYIWTEEPLIECYNRLPMLPEKYSELLCSVFTISKPETKEYPASIYDVPPTYSEALKALQYCDASNPDRTGYWIPISLAFKLVSGDAGFHDWDNWCATGGKTYNKSQQRSVWRSLDAHSVRYNTLVYFAKQRGYEPPRNTPLKPVISMKIEEWTSRKLEAYAESIKESEIIPDFYTNAPHHVKVICNWINSTSRYPQPLLVLGSVLAFLGFYMGKNFKYKGIKGNLYTINLARTGHGKEHIISCLRGLASKLNMTNHTSAMWTSDSAIMEKLNECGGHCIYITDEMYSMMRSLANKSSASREGAAASTLLRAYTGKKLDGLDYAKRKERATIVIEHPFVSIAGYSTPEPFYEAIGSTEAFNGFVGRLTVFEGTKILPQRNKDHDAFADEKIPSDVLQIFKDIDANREKEYSGTGFFTYSGLKQVIAQKEAASLLEQINDEIDDRRRQYDQESDQMANVIGRIFEMMLKYSLIASKGHEITIEHINWAKAVADYNIGVIVAASSNFADTRFERKKNHVIEYITKKGGLIGKSEFTEGCRIFENRKEREDIINDLEDAGKLEKITLEGSTKSATGYKLIKS